jgi:hypothetical protein
MAAGTISGRGGVDLTVALEATRHTLCFVCQRYLARSILGIWGSWKTSRPGQPQDRVSFGHILATRRSPASREGSRPGVEGLRRVRRRVAQAAPGHRRRSDRREAGLRRGSRGAPRPAQGQKRRDCRGVDLGSHPCSYSPREAGAIWIRRPALSNDVDYWRPFRRVRSAS